MVTVERVLAPNPSQFTGPGTNTYVVGGSAGVLVVDPGPREASHEKAIVAVVAGRRVDGVVVTHTHPDHAPLANPLARAFGVEAAGYAPGPEFEPDRLLGDGDTVTTGDVALEVVYTPGHSTDHVCFRMGRVLFTGDHIMGGSSVVVEELGPYMRSLDRLEKLSLDRLYPGHGPEIDRPAEVISWYIAHRRQREEQILAALGAGARSVGGVVEIVYVDVDPSLHPAAAFSVEAHLRKLAEDGVVRFAGGGWDAPVELAGG